MTRKVRTSSTSRALSAQGERLRCAPNSAETIRRQPQHQVLHYLAAPFSSESPQAAHRLCLAHTLQLCKMARDADSAKRDESLPLPSTRQATREQHPPKQSVADHSSVAAQHPQPQLLPTAEHDRDSRDPTTASRVLQALTAQTRTSAKRNATHRDSKCTNAQLEACFPCAR